jgi:hypothetical protein
VRRAVAILAFWLLYAAMPVVVGFHRTDPLACCRLKGAHACFLRTKGGATLGPRSTACAIATAKGVTPQTAVLCTPLLGATPARSRVAASAVTAPRSVTPRTIRSPRAPPVALV